MTQGFCVGDKVRDYRGNEGVIALLTSDGQSAIVRLRCEVGAAVEAILLSRLTKVGEPTPDASAIR